MKIFTNKIFLVVLALIIALIWVQVYYILSSYSRDVNSYASLVKWVWTLTRDTKSTILKVDEKKQLQVWDTIATMWQDSILVIEWWDKSITRLSWNSRVVIKETDISKDLSKINISFELLKWKTWSTVVSMFSGENHFKQEINGSVAAVRWTIFEASSDDNYIRVIDHEVSVESWSWETKTIHTWEAIDLKSFSLKALQNAIDKSWEDLNKTLDKDYLKNLQADIINQFKTNNVFKNIANNVKSNYDDQYKAYMLALNWSWSDLKTYISSLDATKKQEFINSLKTVYQSLNSTDEETSQDLYESKLSTKEVLIENTTDEEYKKSLLKYTIYDLNKLMIDDNEINKKVIENTKKFLDDNKEYIDTSKDFLKNLWNTNNSALTNFLDNISTSNIDVNKLKDDAKNAKNATQDYINNQLNNLFNVNK